jgi:hypothetical protein
LAIPQVFLFGACQTLSFKIVLVLASHAAYTFGSIDSMKALDQKLPTIYVLIVGLLGCMLYAFVSNQIANFIVHKAGLSGWGETLVRIALLNLPF